jgi:hypothetical protein
MEVEAVCGYHQWYINAAPRKSLLNRCHDHSTSQPNGQTGVPITARPSIPHTKFQAPPSHTTSPPLSPFSSLSSSLPRRLRTSNTAVLTASGEGTSPRPRHGTCRTPAVWMRGVQGDAVYRMTLGRGWDAYNRMAWSAYHKLSGSKGEWEKGCRSRGHTHPHPQTNPGSSRQAHNLWLFSLPA